jgi:hypothetical protein
MTTTTVAAVILTAVLMGIAVDYFARRMRTAESAAHIHQAEAAYLRTENHGLTRMLARAVTQNAQVVKDAAVDAEWAAVVLAVTQAERDMYQTALRGELTRQVRAELLRPDEQAAEVVSIERKRAK